MIKRNLTGPTVGIARPIIIPSEFGRREESQSLDQDNG